MPLPTQSGLGGDVGSLKPPRMEDQPHANILIGNGPPANTLGQVGQIYFNLGGGSNTRVYQKTGVSTWTPLTTG